MLRPLGPPVWRLLGSINSNLIGRAGDAFNDYLHQLFRKKENTTPNMDDMLTSKDTKQHGRPKFWNHINEYQWVVNLSKYFTSYISPIFKMHTFFESIRFIWILSIPRRLTSNVTSRKLKSIWIPHRIHLKSTLPLNDNSLKTTWQLLPIQSRITKT